MAGAREANERRLRRLTQMDKSRSVAGASKALRDIWEAGRKPDAVVLRGTLLEVSEGRPPLTRLVLPKGIAMRFYLLAVFEAQCRLNVGEPWGNALPLSGRGSWSDLVAIDGAYDTQSATYMRDTNGDRKLEDLRLRQVQGALRTLEELGLEQALVTMPRGKRGQRLYESFSLMKESGRGGNQTPDTYTVPQNHWSAATITIPTDFFLNGWIQVLNPSEVATWLILRGLSQWARDTHIKSGVYLYGQARLEGFGLRRDAWEDGCQRLREFGLIRFARPPREAGTATGMFANTWELLTRLSRERYEPRRYQVTDHGFAEDAVKKCMKELTLRQKDLDGAGRALGSKADVPPP